MPDAASENSSRSTLVRSKTLCRRKRRLAWIGWGGLATIVLAYALAQICGSAQARPPIMLGKDRKEKDDRVEELMERVHEGKRSPLARTKAQLATNAPNWNELDKHTTAFSDMSAALKKSSVAAIRDAADGYADAVNELATAVKKRDRKMASSAFKLLTSSCADCHYKDGPGGQLDDD